MSREPVRIARVAAADVRPLRSSVLRPGVPPEALVYDGDASPDALHVAALDPSARVVGIASLCREPAKEERLAIDGWRLRGMATAPEVRGLGLGSRLLNACFDHVRDHGGGVLWCNARNVALDFYRKHRLETVGEQFEIAGIGPHYVMRRVLPRLRAATRDDAVASSELALRAKAIAGYDAAFLERCRPALAVTPDQIDSPTRRMVVATLVVARVETIAGFSAAEPLNDREWRLDALFVAPEWVRRGVGRALLDDVRAAVAARGGETLLLDADPYAAPFYERNGGERVGSTPSEIDPSRSLPRYRFAVR